MSASELSLGLTHAERRNISVLNDERTRNLASFSAELAQMPIVREVDYYLAQTEGMYQPGEPEFGGRIALQQARESYNPNYGIGVCLVEVRGDVARLFLGGNRMVTGSQVQQLNHHAETGALTKWAGYLQGNEQADLAMRIQPGQFGIEYGFISYGTLEPCIKCTGEMVNAVKIAKNNIHPDAQIVCASLNVDGYYEEDGKGVGRSNGAAIALGKKSQTVPLVWDGIARGSFDFSKEPARRPLTFALMHTTDDSLEGFASPGMYIPTRDKDLEDLSWRIFAETRGVIDELLMTGKLPVK